MQMVLAANACFEIWVLLRDASVPDFVEAARRKYEDFFLPTKHAHLVAIMSALFKLYDSRSDVISIPAVRKKLSPSEAAATEADLTAATAIWKKIKIPRHKFFAHRDGSKTAQQILAEAGLSVAEMKDLIDLSRRLVDQLSIKFQVPPLPEINAKNTTLQMLNRL